MANSGICVAKIDTSSDTSSSHSDNSDIKILYSDVILSDKKKETIPRIKGLVDDIFKLYNKYEPDVVVRESPFVGRSSTTKGVLYSHAILEFKMFQKNIDIIDIHNASLKAYCRKYLLDKCFYTKEELKQFNKKEIVAEFLKSYFSSDMPEIYSDRGKLLDDVSDACALSCFWFENIYKG